MAQRVDPTRHRADGTTVAPLSIKHPNAELGEDTGDGNDADRPRCVLPA